MSHKHTWMYRDTKNGSECWYCVECRELQQRSIGSLDLTGEGNK
jgi:hypothetical protein